MKTKENESNTTPESEIDTIVETQDGKEDLRNAVTLMREGNQDEAGEAFSSFITEKAKSILADVKDVEVKSTDD